MEETVRQPLYRYSRAALYLLRRRTPHTSSYTSPLDVAYWKYQLGRISQGGILHYRGGRAGRRKQRNIQVVLDRGRGNGDQSTYSHSGDTLRTYRQSTLVQCQLNAAISNLNHTPAARPTVTNNSTVITAGVTSGTRAAPTIYVINAAALSKPHAIQQLTADVQGYTVDVVLVTETHLKKKHPTEMFNIDGFHLFRRDREGRRGGGVAIYARQALHPTLWPVSACQQGGTEVLWITFLYKGEETFIGCVYHPPKPVYKPEQLLGELGVVVGDIILTRPSASVTLGGDFNQLPDDDVIDHTGLIPIVKEPTRGRNILDQIFTSSIRYHKVKVIKSTLRSDHMCVIAYAGKNICCYDKTFKKCSFRKQSPDQKSSFLRGAQIITTAELRSMPTVQPALDAFYKSLLDNLDTFFPEKSVKLTSRDPPYITPAVKSMLMEKNKLMRANRVEQAGALATKIGISIIRFNAASLATCDKKASASDMWTKVNQLLHPTKPVMVPDGITAVALNTQFAAVATDSFYTAPSMKQSTCTDPNVAFFSEYTVFKMLDNLPITATGPDQLPAWYLKLAAPLVCSQLTHLLNESIRDSVVPAQWKTARITPIPKVPAPTSTSDFRPISITSVLSRAFEKLVVRKYMYPAFLDPPTTLGFSDQYAFRPTGSTTAALVSTFNLITSILETDEYVHMIALDFSRAFDSVRHHTLLSKMSQLSLPDNVYNWLLHFFEDHQQCTLFDGITSDVAPINAGVIQGSAVGPASFLVCASDLHSVSSGNHTNKYADDVILIVPAANTNTRSIEIENVNRWAAENNLKLNASKSKEIIFRCQRKRKSSTPSTIPGVQRVESIVLLGVTLTSDLKMTEHINTKLLQSSRSLFALRTLKAHGMPQPEVAEVFRSTVLNSLLYASPAWWGFTVQENITRMESFLRRAVKSGFYPSTSPPLVDIVRKTEHTLFKSILSNPAHILSNLLPPLRSTVYSLRQRAHSYQLPKKTSTLKARNFMMRLLYDDAY